MKLNIKKVILVVSITIVCIIGVFLGIKKVSFNDEPTPTKETKSYQEPSNTFVSLSYYRKENLKKYERYKNDNPTLSIEDIVTHVNMGIDTPFYSTDPIVITNPDALDVLVNKVYKLPDNWEPRDLVVVDDNGQKMRKEAAEAYFDLKEACRNNGFTLTAHSGYRSTAFQAQIYQNMIDVYGEEYTNKYSSRPGQSEHTTGLCVDISIDSIHYENIESSPYYDDFNEALEAYGFIIRYPNDKENLTGYYYESWHIRYLGKELAKKVNASGLTYDEYVARQ